MLRSLLCWSLVLAWSAVAMAQEAAVPVLKTPVSKLDLVDGDSIVFLGDSITHQCLYTQYVEDYFYTRFPKMRLKIHNAGVGGARAWDALARFDKDVAEYKPKYVTILLGMNDGTYRPFDQPTFDTYKKDMTELLGKLQGIGATPILMTPTMFDSRADRARPNNKRDPLSQAEYNSTLAYYGTWLREVAVENGHGYVDMWGPLNNLTLEQRKVEPAFTLIRDAVHPDAPGQLVMAVSIITDMDLPRSVSGISINLNAKNEKQRAKGTGGVIEGLSQTEDGVEFTFAAESLPWVMPEEARLGAQLTKLGHRLSSERLTVHGLPAGQYELSIDGQSVDTYAHTALAAHIELQENDKTPQYQQALAIAMLNKQRNDGPVKALRGEWGRFQGFARTRRDAEANPTDTGKQEQLAKQTESMKGMEDRVAKANADAKLIEDEIFTKNQPLVRKYVLKRSAGK
ncbi:MAG: hypothetical protein DWH91_03925 [Planctomycetota bacterium]|nr:MAG: hypothetical protein DWH91_03925 [Planctomycetota bacterium]